MPVRGRLLAEHLSPTVGTVIETHPRASLLFGLGEEFLELIREYKPKRDDTKSAAEARRSHTRTLWRAWSEAFGILTHEPVYHDGALDSLVCATVAHLYHHAPAALHKLRHEVPGKVGRGPFYVVAPEDGTLKPRNAWRVARRLAAQSSSMAAKNCEVLIGAPVWSPVRYGPT